MHDEVLARVFGILEGLMTVCLAIGSILLPVAVGLLGIPAAAAAFALVIPLVVLLASPGLRGIDRRANVPVRALSLLRRLPLFASLSPPTLESLARSGVWQSVPPVDRGDPGGRSRRAVLRAGGRLARRQPGRRVRADAVVSGRRVRRDRAAPERAADRHGHRDRGLQLLGIGRTEFLAAVTGQAVVSATAGRIVDAYLDHDRVLPTGDPESAAPPSESAQG